VIAASSVRVPLAIGGPASPARFSAHFDVVEPVKDILARTSTPDYGIEL
jgi:hypothetical protein